MKITSQIGKCGELLVQYRLLRHGIESSPMTTDAGIDLVAYAPGSQRAITIQVKAVWKPKPAGGKGGLLLDWWIRNNSPAELIAFVDLESESVWLFRHVEVRAKRLHSAKPLKDNLHFGFYVDPDYKPRSKSYHKRDFDDLNMERRIHDLFGDSQISN